MSLYFFVHAYYKHIKCNYLPNVMMLGTRDLKTSKTQFLPANALDFKSLVMSCSVSYGTLTTLKSILTF